LGEGDGVNKKLKKLRQVLWKLYVFLGAAFLSVLAGTLSYSGVLDQADKVVSDVIYQWINHNRHETMVKLIVIDSDTVEKLGAYEDWSRSQMAQFIETLNSVPKDAPNVIGLNLDFYGEKDKDGDTQLIDVCKTYDNICIRAKALVKEEIQKHEEGHGEEMTFPKDEQELMESQDASKDFNGREEVAGIRMPYQGLLPYVITGATNIAVYSEDGYIRSALASININGIEMDSFPVAIYKMYMDSIGKAYTLPKLDIDNSFAFNYSKKSTDYTVYSFYDVLTGQIPVSTFRNSIVLISDNTEEESSYKVPNQRNILMSEVKLEANILEALLTQKTGQNVSKVFLAVSYGIFVAAFFVVTSFGSGLRKIVEASLVIVIQVFFCCLLNHWGYYVPLLIPIWFVLVITAINLLALYIRARRERYELEGVFKKYVDKQVVNELVKGGEIAAEIGVIRKDIAVLFVDIRGFTSLSEKMEPEQVVDILNNYLSLVAKAVETNNGTLDKFIGDAAMAVFNSPTDMEDYVYKAVCTAWDIRSNAVTLEKTYMEKYGCHVTFGIGVHCGEAVIGNIGCKSRMDYTAIGDTVNTASRLEGIADSSQILISSEVKDRLGERIKTSFAGEVNLKGKKEMVSLYEVEGILREEKGTARKLVFGWKNV